MQDNLPKTKEKSQLFTQLTATLSLLRENKTLILKKSVGLHLPEAIQSAIVFGLPNIRYQDTKKSLHKITLQITAARKAFIIGMIHEIPEQLAIFDNFLLSEEQAKKVTDEIDPILSNIKALLQKNRETELPEKTVRDLLEQINLLRIKANEIYGNRVPSVVASELEEIRTVLSDELDDCPYKLRKKDPTQDPIALTKYAIKSAAKREIDPPIPTQSNTLVKDEIDYNDLSKLGKTVFWINGLSSLIIFLASITAFILLFLAITALLFSLPYSGPVLTGLAVTSVIISAFTIVIIGANAVKWGAEDRVQQNRKITKSQVISGIVNFLGLAFSIVFLYFGVSALIPGGASILAIPYLPKMGVHINKAIIHINQAIKKVHFFLQSKSFIIGIVSFSRQIWTKTLSIGTGIGAACNTVISFFTGNKNNNNNIAVTDNAQTAISIPTEAPAEPAQQLAVASEPIEIQPAQELYDANLAIEKLDRLSAYAENENQKLRQQAALHLENINTAAESIISALSMAPQTQPEKAPTEPTAFSHHSSSDDALLAEGLFGTVNERHMHKLDETATHLENIASADKEAIKEEEEEEMSDSESF